jgi:hypothetical protein
LVGYGYRTYRAALWLAALLVAGYISFGYAKAHGLITAAGASSDQTDFNLFAYTVDWTVPVLSLHQREAWINHGLAQWLALGLATAGWVLTTAVVLGISGVLKKDNA